MWAMFRMWWMMFWRLGLLTFFTYFFNGVAGSLGVGGIFVISVIASIVLYKGFGVEVFSFPLVKMFRGEEWYVKLSGSVSTKPRVKTGEKERTSIVGGFLDGFSEGGKSKFRGGVYPTELSPEARRRADAAAAAAPFTIPREVIKQSTNKGVMTGYERSLLEGLPLPSSEKMFGTPGAGLDDAVDVFSESRVKMGQLGEENFAKALSLTDLSGVKISPELQKAVIPPKNILDQISSYWSVKVPTELHEKDYETDVDCVLVRNRKMVLLDLKYYRDGDVTFYSSGKHLYTVDNATSLWVGEPKDMTRNMEMAVNRFQKRFPSMDVTAMVILVPTDQGAGVMSAQPFTPVYPGEIPLFNINDGMRAISSVFSGEMMYDDTSEVVKRKMHNLLKRSSVA